MSTLPEYLEEETIWGMSPGDRGYTLPWAMFADEDRVLWINGDYPLYAQSMGTAVLRIYRTSDSVVVDEKSIGDYRYSVGSSWITSQHKLPVTLVPTF